MKYGQAFSFLPFIYSEKFIEILKAFNIGNYTIFPFQIKDIDELYYLFFLETITRQEIIFDQSIIYTGHKALNNLKYYDLKNDKEYAELLEDKPLATFDKIAVLKKHYGKDIISVQGANAYFYSEKLIDFLLDCKITGIEVSYKNSIQLEFV